MKEFTIDMLDVDDTRKQIEEKLIPLMGSVSEEVKQKTTEKLTQQLFASAKENIENNKVKLYTEENFDDPKWGCKGKEVVAELLGHGGNKCEFVDYRPKNARYCGPLKVWAWIGDRMNAVLTYNTKSGEVFDIDLEKI